MSSDPEIASRPDFNMIVGAHQQVMADFRESTEDPSFDMVASLQRMADVIEAQGVLMDIVSDRLKSDFRRLQVLNTRDTAAVVSARIKHVMDKLSGLFNGTYGQTARSQTIDLLRRTRPASFSSPATYQNNMDETSQWLQQMRERGAAGR